MINNNWIRSVSKTYQQLNEIEVVPAGALKGASMTFRKRGSGPDGPLGGKGSMKEHMFATGRYHAQQGLGPHPKGANDPHYMAGFNMGRFEKKNT